MGDRRPRIPSIAALQQPGEAANATPTCRRIVLVGRARAAASATTSGRRGEPVDPRVASGPSRPEAASGVQLHPGSTREVHVIDLIGYSTAEMPAPKRSERSAPDQDRKAGASPRWWAVRGQAHRRRHRRRLRRHLPRRPREAQGGRQVQGAGRATLARDAELHAVDAHINGVRWAGEFTVETPGTLAVHLRGLDRPLGDLPRRAAPQGRRRPRRGPLAARSPRASCSSSSALDARQGRRARTRSQYALGVLGRRRADAARSSTSRSARSSSTRWRRPRSARARRRSRSRSSSRSTASRRASAPGTSSSRAPGAA